MLPQGEGEGWRETLALKMGRGAVLRQHHCGAVQLFQPLRSNNYGVKPIIVWANGSGVLGTLCHGQYQHDF